MMPDAKASGMRHDEPGWVSPLVCDAPSQLRGVIRHIGPGLILSASIVGSGELIVTTRLGSESGFSLLWFIVFACVIKVFLQVEIGRYAITQGQTSLQALNNIPGPRLVVSWLVWVWLGMFVATFFQVAGMLGGVSALFSYAGLGSHWPGWTWPLLISVVTAVLLAIGRYRFIERFSAAMVATFTLFTVASAVALHWTDYGIQGSELLHGFTFKLPTDWTTAFVAFGVVGVGASELIYYPYWCLEKGYGAFTGPNDGSAEWQMRAKGWQRVLQVDAWISMLVYTVATVAFYLLGAAILHRKGLIVDDHQMVPTLSHMYRETFGQVGFWGYILGAFVVLYSTVFLATASNGRLVADLCQMFGFVQIGTEERRQRIIKTACVTLTLVYFFLFTTITAPVTLVLIGALAQALMLPFLAAAALYFLYRKTDTAMKPSAISQILLWISGSLMTAMGLYQIFSAVFKR